MTGTVALVAFTALLLSVAALALSLVALAASRDRMTYRPPEED